MKVFNFETDSWEAPQESLQSWQLEGTLEEISALLREKMAVKPPEYFLRGFDQVPFEEVALTAPARAIGRLVSVRWPLPHHEESQGWIEGVWG